MKRHFWWLAGFLVLALLLLPATGVAAPQKTDIAAGGDHTLALRPDESLWTWGYYGQGQLGLNDTTDRLTLTQVPRFNPASAVVISLCCAGAKAAFSRSDAFLWDY